MHNPSVSVWLATILILAPAPAPYGGWAKVALAMLMFVLAVLGVFG